MCVCVCFSSFSWLAAVCVCVCFFLFARLFCRALFSSRLTHTPHTHKTPNDRRLPVGDWRRVPRQRQPQPEPRDRRPQGEFVCCFSFRECGWRVQREGPRGGARRRHDGGSMIKGALSMPANPSAPTHAAPLAPHTHTQHTHTRHTRAHNQPNTVQGQCRAAGGGADHYGAARRDEVPAHGRRPLLPARVRRRVGRDEQPGAWYLGGSWVVAGRGGATACGT